MHLAENTYQWELQQFTDISRELPTHQQVFDNLYRVLSLLARTFNEQFAESGTVDGVPCKMRALRQRKFNLVEVIEIAKTQMYKGKKPCIFLINNILLLLIRL